MEEEKFKNLIDREKYQVFLFRCKAHFPFQFADHLWFVVNKKGEISRWEILYKKDPTFPTHWGYLYKNFHSPFVGINIFNFWKKYSWNSQLLHSIEGDENSVAQKMADFIENSSKDYPLREKYSLLGPHCATYVQWVLNHFPEFNFKMRNYIGKNYRQ